MMGKPAIGTLAWIEKTGGKLGWRDRLTIMAEAVRARRAARAAGHSQHALRHVEIDEVLPPDSAICKAAEALCFGASERYLANHCMRAYFFARLKNGKRAIDGEALYVAFLLHDLGLTPKYRLKPAEGECFTIAGARAAETLARNHHWDDKRARLAAEAITLHLNVIVGAPHSLEAQLLRFGTAADVAGLGLKSFPAEQKDEVVRLYPRLGMKAAITRDFEAEAYARSSCRAAFMMKRGNLAKLIAGAPFAD
jgi:hypothetical protein